MSLACLIWHLSWELIPGDAWFSWISHLPISSKFYSPVPPEIDILWLKEHSEFCFMSQRWTWMKWSLGLEYVMVSRLLQSVVEVASFWAYNALGFLSDCGFLGLWVWLTCVWEHERQHWALTVGTEHFFMVFSVWQKLADNLSLVQSESVGGEKK